MKTGVLQLTMREWRAQMANRTLVLVLIGTGAILAIVGPFGTDERTTLLPRFAYWVTLVFLTYGWGAAAFLVSRRVAPESPVTATGLSMLLTGMGAMAVVYLLNGLSFQYWPRGGELAAQAVNVFVIAGILAGIMQLAYNASAPHVPAPPAAARLLERLPLDKRGALVSMTVEDHYVRVRTTKGEELLLLRLSDAVEEVGDTRGARVHRSHWAAFDQVCEMTRKGDGALLTMTHGPDIPVSRANMTVVRDGIADRLRPRVR